MHKIRLRGPWTSRLEADSLILQRRFHGPPGLRDERSVKLCWQFPANPTIVPQVQINDIVLEYVVENGTSISEIAKILKPFNIVQIQIPVKQMELDGQNCCNNLQQNLPIQIEAWLEILEIDSSA